MRVQVYESSSTQKMFPRKVSKINLSGWVYIVSTIRSSYSPLPALSSDQLRTLISASQMRSAVTILRAEHWPFEAENRAAHSPKHLPDTQGFFHTPQTDCHKGCVSQDSPQPYPLIRSTCKHFHLTPNTTKVDIL